MKFVITRGVMDYLRYTLNSAGLVPIFFFLLNDPLNKDSYSIM